jgi:hypothetical protein
MGLEEVDVLGVSSAAGDDQIGGLRNRRPKESIHDSATRLVGLSIIPRHHSHDPFIFFEDGVEHEVWLAESHTFLKVLLDGVSLEPAEGSAKKGGEKAITLAVTLAKPSVMVSRERVNLDRPRKASRLGAPRMT